MILRQVLPQKWETLAIIPAGKDAYTISFSNLQVGDSYKFRTVAKNKFGVSYPSPASDAVIIPSMYDMYILVLAVQSRLLDYLLRCFLAPKDKPFYLKWPFMVILALASLLILAVVIAILYITGRNNKSKFQCMQVLTLLCLSQLYFVQFVPFECLHAYKIKFWF